VQQQQQQQQQQLQEDDSSSLITAAAAWCCLRRYVTCDIEPYCRTAHLCQLVGHQPGHVAASHLGLEPNGDSSSSSSSSSR
jgi:hypothetical protein